MPQRFVNCQKCGAQIPRGKDGSPEYCPCGCRLNGADLKRRHPKGKSYFAIFVMIVVMVFLQKPFVDAHFPTAAGRILGEGLLAGFGMAVGQAISYLLTKVWTHFNRPGTPPANSDAQAISLLREFQRRKEK